MLDFTRHLETFCRRRVYFSSVNKKIKVCYVFIMKLKSGNMAMRGFSRIPSEQEALVTFQQMREELFTNFKKNI